MEWRGRGAHIKTYFSVCFWFSLSFVTVTARVLASSILFPFFFVVGGNWYLALCNDFTCLWELFGGRWRDLNCMYIANAEATLSICSIREDASSKI